VPFAFDPAIGIHAAFVNTDTGIETGLGVTASLWRDHLRFGPGCNVIAPGSDDGRYYVCVGAGSCSARGHGRERSSGLCARSSRSR